MMDYTTALWVFPIVTLFGGLALDYFVFAKLPTQRDFGNGAILSEDSAVKLGYAGSGMLGCGSLAMCGWPLMGMLVHTDLRDEFTLACMAAVFVALFVKAISISIRRDKGVENGIYAAALIYSFLFPVVFAAATILFILFHSNWLFESRPVHLTGDLITLQVVGVIPGIAGVIASGHFKIKSRTVMFPWSDRPEIMITGWERDDRLK